MIEDEYDDPQKQREWEIYWRGYSDGRGVEEMSYDNYRTAVQLFEQYMKRNHE